MESVREKQEHEFCQLQTFPNATGSLFQGYFMLSCLAFNVCTRNWFTTLEIKLTHLMPVSSWYHWPDSSWTSALTSTPTTRKSHRLGLEVLQGWATSLGWRINHRGWGLLLFGLAHASTAEKTQGQCREASTAFPAPPQLRKLPKSSRASQSKVWGRRALTYRD